MTVQIGLTVSGKDFGETPLAAPSGVDLLATADSGNASDDNLTNRNNASASVILQFQVSGVTDGATVRVYSDGVLIGAGTAASGAALITTDGVTAISDGTHGITATQTLSSGTSAASAAWAVTIDATPPAAFTNTAPDFAQVLQAYAFDANSADEGQAGMSYVLLDAPAGMTIEASSGVINWTPNAEQTGLHAFTIELTDAAGNIRSQTANLTVLGVLPAYPDTYSLDVNSALTTDATTGVLVNDGGGTSAVLAATLVASPAHGTLTFNADGTFTYTPTANFSGTDSFTYQASDGTDASNVAQVKLSVVGVNSPSATCSLGGFVFIDVSWDGIRDNSEWGVPGVVITLAGTDTASGQITRTAMTAHDGSLTLNTDGSFTYTPNASSSGSDTFRYCAYDGLSESNSGTVTIDVTTPLALVLPTEFTDPQQVAQRTVGQTLDFVVGVNPAQAADCTFQLDLESSGIPDGQALPTIDASTGRFLWTPSATGRFQIGVLVVLANGAAGQATFLIDIVLGT
ncbi:MAG: tandem-95 repeat protein [Planctomycetota bacterium]|nr:tandem-95 repeat protein [Planctomycetota bacterium]